MKNSRFLSWYSWSNFCDKTIVFENMLFIVASWHWFYTLLWFLKNQMLSFFEGGGVAYGFMYVYTLVCSWYFYFFMQCDFNTCNFVNILYTVRSRQRHSSNPHNSGYKGNKIINLFCVKKCMMSTMSQHTLFQRCLEILKPISKTIPPLWFYKTRLKPIGKSANALKL